MVFFDWPPMQFVDLNRVHKENAGCYWKVDDQDKVASPRLEEHRRTIVDKTGITKEVVDLREHEQVREAQK